MSEQDENSDALNITNTTESISSLSSGSKTYSYDDLESKSVVYSEKPKKTTLLRHSLKSHQAFFSILSIVLVILVTIAILSFLILRREPVENASSIDNFETAQPNLGNITDSLESVEEAGAVSINGRLEVNNSLVVSPSIKPSTLSEGQIYFDSEDSKLYFYNGKESIQLGSSSSVVIQGPAGANGKDGANGRDGRDGVDGKDGTSSAGNFALLDGTGPQVFTGNNRFNGTFRHQNSTNSTSAFQIQDAAGSSNLLIADTINGRIAVGKATANYTLDVDGDVNLSSGSVFRINGVAVCDVSGCSASGGSGSFIQNSVLVQAGANFNIQSISASNIGGVIQGAVGQTAHLFQLKDSAGTVMTAFDSLGRLVFSPDSIYNVSLYHRTSDGNTLATDGFLDVNRRLSVRQGGGAKDALNLVSFSLNTGITIGSDVNIYRGAVNGLYTDDSLRVGTNLEVVGSSTLDDLAVNGGDLTTSATTFNLLNTAATTLNAFGAATTINLGAAGATITGGGALSLQSGGTNTTLTLQSNGSGAVNIDSGTTGAINIGTNSNGKIITVGNATPATSVAVLCGTGGACFFGNNATSHATTVGSTTNTSSLLLQGGTGDVNITSTDEITIASTNNMVLSSAEFGDIEVVSGDNGNITVSAGVSANGSLSLNAGAGGVNLGNGGIANTIQIGNTSGAVSQTTNIGTNATASSTNNVNIGSSIAGTTAITGPTAITNRTSGSAETLIISNSTSTGNVLQARDNSTAVMTIANGGATTFTNETNSTAAFRIQNSGGSSTLFNADTTNMIISVSGTTTNFANLTLDNAHFKSQQTNAPTIGTPANCGATPTATVTANSTDSAGSFTITTGTGALGTGTCDTVVTFDKAHSIAPKSVIITPKSATSPNKGLYISATSSTTFTTSFSIAATVNSEANEYYYWVIE